MVIIFFLLGLLELHCDGESIYLPLVHTLYRSFRLFLGVVVYDGIVLEAPEPARVYVSKVREYLADVFLGDVGTEILHDDSDDFHGVL